MSNLRSWKAIKNPVFEQSQNTLIIQDRNADPEFSFYSKIEDKIEMLKFANDDFCWKILFAWVWAKRSDVFELDNDDIKRLLDNQEK